MTTEVRALGLLLLRVKSSLIAMPPSHVPWALRLEGASNLYRYRNCNAFVRLNYHLSNPFKPTIPIFFGASGWGLLSTINYYDLYSSRNVSHDAEAVIRGSEFRVESLSLHVRYAVADQLSRQRALKRPILRIPRTKVVHYNIIHSVIFEKSHLKAAPRPLISPPSLGRLPSCREVTATISNVVGK